MKTPEQIAEIEWTNSDGITYEPFIEGHILGYRITELQTGKVEYMLLSPTEHHEINPDNGATADTFLYHVDHLGAESYQEAPDDGTVSIIDFAYPAIYLNHFNGSWTDPEDF